MAILSRCLSLPTSFIDRCHGLLFSSPSGHDHRCLHFVYLDGVLARQTQPPFFPCVVLMPSFSPHAFILSTCLHSLHMPSFSPHAFILTTCLHSHHMPSFSPHAFILSTCLHSHHMPSFSPHAFILSTCLHSLHMPSFSPHAFILSTCLRSLHMLVRFTRLFHQSTHYPLLDTKLFHGVIS